MPDGLIITFILKVLSLCWVVCACVLLFFFSSRDEKRDVLIVLPNHSDGLQARDFCVTQWHTEMVLIFFSSYSEVGGCGATWSCQIRYEYIFSEGDFHAHWRTRRKHSYAFLRDESFLFSSDIISVI